MKTVFQDKIRVDITLPKAEAERLLSLLKDDIEFDGLGGMLKAGLAPRYEYTVKCFGCGHKMAIWAKEPQTKEQLKKTEEYILCGPCFDSEDFK